MKSYLRVLRHQDFRYLFLGQSASVLGDRVVVVAIALYVTQTTGSAIDLGLVLGAQALALVALLLFGGVWADRLPRHRIMIGADGVRALLHALLAGLIFAGMVQIWQLVAIEAAFGAAQAFFQPAYSGLIPQTVPEELIQDARALTEFVEDMAFLLGAALATALVLGVGAGTAFALDAASFVVSAVLLTRVRPRPRGEAKEPETVVHELRVGWREVRSRAWVWVTIAAFSGALLTVYSQWYALAPVIARDFYGGTGVFGVLEALAGAGAVLGAVTGTWWKPAHPLRTGLCLVLAWPLENGLFALHAPLAIVAVWSFATGFGFALLIIWWETALARHIPAHALSRVSAYDWMGSAALLPVGYLIAGPLASAFGASTVLGVGAVLGFGLLALALVPKSTRALSDGTSARRAAPAVPARPSAEPRPSAEQVPSEVRVEARSEA